MAYREIIISGQNFLASEVGLRTITYNFSQVNSNVTTENVNGMTRKIIKAGTIYPSNDNNAVGIVFQDVDVTDGNKSDALMVGGVVLKTKTLVAGVETPISETALPVLNSKGIFVQEVPTVSYPSDGTL